MRVYVVEVKDKFSPWKPSKNGKHLHVYTTRAEARGVRRVFNQAAGSKEFGIQFRVRPCMLEEAEQVERRRVRHPMKMLRDMQRLGLAKDRRRDVS